MDSVRMTEEEKYAGVKNGPNLDGASGIVKTRFREAIRRAEKWHDWMVFPDGYERAMIGTAVRESGVEVPVYESGLCIECNMTRTGASYDDAVDDFSYNMVGACPSFHGHAPMLIDFIIDSGERSDTQRYDMNMVGKLDGRWNGALVGTTEGPNCEPVAVYEFGLFVKSVMSDMGVDAKFGKKLAKKYIDECINGDKPVILYGFKVDADRWDAISKDINDELIEDFFNA